MRRPTALLAALLVALLPLAACGDDGGGPDEATGTDRTTAPAESPFVGKTYESTALEDIGEGEGVTPPLVPGTPIRITFGEDDIEVETGCNRLSGTYTVEGPLLVVEDLAGTEMACEDDLQDQETFIAGALIERPSVSPQPPDGLRISGEEWALTMIDAEVAAENLDLVGPTWTADTILDGEGASSLPGGVTVTLTFADDGTYQVAAGCNTGSGTYAPNPGTYEFQPPTLTRLACTGEAAEVEAKVVATLDGAVTTLIEGDRLTLTDFDHVGLSFTGA